ncbi:Peptidase S53 domain-containing protein [Mycena chlorophos]|uniref:Peptidase S53 domain-containing protein n=1 Tax=Mycena chlorophos TaxID=658473 RepID=A0A8H6S1E1_MYCCL|nr:Peptidase S53 domain-containing protein [Mycena chlorophos]
MLGSRSDVIKKSHLFSCFDASSESFCWEAPTTRSHAIIDTTWTSIKSCAARDNLPFPPSMWFGSLLALLALAGSVSAASRVKESVFAPRGWIQHSAAPADHIVKLRIALPQPNFPALEDALYAVSDPTHERYGAHLSKEQVEELIAPHAESVEAVNEWLYSHGVQDSDIARSSAGDWLTIRLPVALAEGMLDTKYHVWKNIKNGEYLVRTTSYSLPEHLHQHIELIQPTTLFGSFRRLTSTIYSKTPVHASSQDGPSSLARIVDPKTGISVDASCNQTITISCLKQIYNAVDYKTRGKGSVAVTGYLGEFANRQDLQSLFKAEVPAAVGTTFKFISVNNGTDPQDPEDAGGEANLDSQFAFGLSFPVPSTFYSTAGSPPFIPDLGTPTDTNEPYTEWLDFILNQKEPPSVVSTSYEDDEQSVPLSFAQRACAGFAQLGARGTSLTFSSGGMLLFCVDFSVVMSIQTVVSATAIPTQQLKNALPTTERIALDSSRARFPSSCPFTTSVGGTFLFPETAVPFSGGGFSNYFARPSYQKAAVQKFLDGLAPGTYAGLFNTTGRAFPDVSAQSVNFTVWVGGEEFLIGGTSASAPAFAGFIALLNDARISKGQKPLGFLNPLIYGLDGKGFFDITTGNNPGCGTEGFNATVGWDAVTGLGTPNFGELVKLVT